MKDIDLRDLFALAIAAGFAARDGHYDPRYDEHIGEYSFDKVGCMRVYIIADEMLAARQATARD